MISNRIKKAVAGVAAGVAGLAISVVGIAAPHSASAAEKVTFTVGIQDAVDSNMPVGKRVLRADDFLPDKNWGGRRVT